MCRTAVPITLLYEFCFSWLRGLVLLKTDALALEVLSTFFFCDTSRAPVSLFSKSLPHCSHSLGFKGLKTRLLAAAWALLAQNRASRSRCVAKKFRLRHLKHGRLIFGTERLAAAGRVFLCLAKVALGRHSGLDFHRFFLNFLSWGLPFCSVLIRSDPF